MPRPRRPYVHPDTGEGMSTLSGWSDVIADHGRQRDARPRHLAGGPASPDPDRYADLDRYRDPQPVAECPDCGRTLGLILGRIPNHDCPGRRSGR